MATLERYSSFEEMEEAQAKYQAMGKSKPAKAKRQNTIKAFAALLRKNTVDPNRHQHTRKK